MPKLQDISKITKQGYGLAKKNMERKVVNAGALKGVQGYHRYRGPDFSGGPEILEIPCVIFIQK